MLMQQQQQQPQPHISNSHTPTPKNRSGGAGIRNSGGGGYTQHRTTRRSMKSTVCITPPSLNRHSMTAEFTHNTPFYRASPKDQIVTQFFRDTRKKQRAAEAVNQSEEATPTAAKHKH